MKQSIIVAVLFGFVVFNYPLGASVAKAQQFRETQHEVLYCRHVQRLIRLMERGVDHVARRFIRDPEYFLTSTVRGWLCGTEPLPPIRRGRHYLEKVTCYAPEKKGHITEEDIVAAGTKFRRNLRRLTRCLRGDTLNSTNISYGDHSQGHKVNGEGISLLLNRTVGRERRGNLLVLEYGYATINPPGDLLQWSLEIGMTDEQNN